MDKEAMKQLILESLSKKLGAGYRISIAEVLKTNLKLDGLTILRHGDNISPTIYLKPFYEELEKGESIENVANSIIQLYFCSEADMRNFDATPIRDFNYVKTRLYTMLVNRHLNTELLQNVPHSLFLDDLAVIVRCLVEAEPDGQSSFLVHNSHLEMWNTDQDTILTIAKQNTRTMFGVDIQNMDDALKELFSDFSNNDGFQLPIWIISNNQKLYGASTILFDDVLQEFANIHGSFYVIFSSVHEVLLFPAEEKLDIDFLTALNQTVNSTQVREEEVLGTKAYLYDKEKGFIVS